jgi:hypothetical protein
MTITMESVKRGNATAEYTQQLQASLRYDVEGRYHYIQLPSHPTLRLVPPKEGTEDEIVGVQNEVHYPTDPLKVKLFNIPSIGVRLFRLPYPSVSPTQAYNMLTQS